MNLKHLKCQLLLNVKEENKNYFLIAVMENKSRKYKNQYSDFEHKRKQNLMLG